MPEAGAAAAGDAAARAVVVWAGSAERAARSDRVAVRWPRSRSLDDVRWPREGVAAPAQGQRPDAGGDDDLGGCVAVPAQIAAELSDVPALVGAHYAVARIGRVRALGRGEVRAGREPRDVLRRG